MKRQCGGGEYKLRKLLLLKSRTNNYKCHLLGEMNHTQHKKELYAQWYKNWQIQSSYNGSAHRIMTNGNCATWLFSSIASFRCNCVRVHRKHDTYIIFALFCLHYILLG